MISRRQALAALALPLAGCWEGAGLLNPCANAGDPGHRIDPALAERVWEGVDPRRVVDLHGRLDRVRCLGCGESDSRETHQRRLEESNPDWRYRSTASAPDGDADLGGVDYDAFRLASCLRCEGALKPDVVFFGESVPRPRVEHAMSQVDAADALLVVGSSLMVWSGFRFARRAAEREIPIAAVNLGRTRADELLTLKIEAPASLVLERLDAML